MCFWICGSLGDLFHRLSFCKDRLFFPRCPRPVVLNLFGPMGLMSGVGSVCGLDLQGWCPDPVHLDQAPCLIRCAGPCYPAYRAPCGSRKLAAGEWQLMLPLLPLYCGEACWLDDMALWARSLGVEQGCSRPRADITFIVQLTQ